MPALLLLPFTCRSCCVLHSTSSSQEGKSPAAMQRRRLDRRQRKGRNAALLCLIHTRPWQLAASSSAHFTSVQASSEAAAAESSGASVAAGASSTAASEAGAPSAAKEPPSADTPPPLGAAEPALTAGEQGWGSTAGRREVGSGTPPKIHDPKHVRPALGCTMPPATPQHHPVLTGGRLANLGHHTWQALECKLVVANRHDVFLIHAA